MHLEQLLLYAFVLLTVVALLVIRWKRQKLYTAAGTMDGPFALPLIGQLYLIFGKKPGDDLFKVLNRYSPLYNSPVGVWIGPFFVVGINDNPDHIQTVLNSPHLLNKTFHYNFFRVGRGLFASPDYIWKNDRKILNRSFSPAMLASFVDTFNDKDFIMVETLKKYVGKGEIDLHLHIAKCNIDAFFSTSFGTDLNMQSHDEADAYLNSLDTFFSLIFKRILSVHRYPKWLYRLTEDYKTETKCWDTIRGMSKRLLQEWKQQPRQTEVRPNDDSYGRKPALNFADNLFDVAENNPSLTDEHIMDHIDTIIAAGHDTTATTVSNLLLMLAIHPEVQEAVYQEVMSVCPDKSKPVTTEEANGLVYTEMVCKETMRLFPVGPLLGRKCVADVQLDEKHTIPAGSCVCIGIYTIHREPSIWGPEAEKFNPDHFLPEKVAKRHPYAYLPFSGGPRNCIGIRYAWLSMKILIAHLVRNYRFATSLKMEDLNMKFAIILRITNGCMVSIEER
ncbi:cytochrome P450 4C1-like [Anopheles ziemanni]|uniref:cytochrome P450 4C1-like n=1 Tax=Anopheles coustani TaxID=139045 RepID=UPI00265840A6|nr:cytochrome P450 4C1-like [Anopheles coustani]XP_058170858.1 cytochrome P450 4C1-like [Anopheles ziemanni]